MRAVLISMLVALTTATASEKGSQRTESRNQVKSGNAALAYWQAIECTIDRNPADATYPEYLRIISEGHKSPLDDTAIRAVHRSGLALYFAHRGIRMDHCDWGLALDDMGPRSEQGHLAHAPKLAGAAFLRARYYFETGKPYDAFNDLVCVLKLARHLGNDGHDGMRALITQASVEQKAIEVAAKYLPQIDAASADRLEAQMATLPCNRILKNFLSAQKKQWAEWPERFAQKAADQAGDWDAYWRAVLLRDANSGTEVGEAIRIAVGGKPQRLEKLATDARAFFERAIKMSDLPAEKFLPAYRALLTKAADQNPLVELSGGEVEPVLDNLILADARRTLFKAGMAVARDGPTELKDFQAPYGPLEYHKYEDGFELTSKIKLGSKPVKLVFRQP